MIAIVPNPIPAEPGRCAVRVTKPETAFELVNPGSWRITLWLGGHCYFGTIAKSQASEEPPTLAACLESYNELPICWTEVLRKPEPKAGA